MTWKDRAQDTINRVHHGLPAGVTLAERMAAVDAAYPFSERSNFPYKAWLAARRSYLARHGYRGRGAQAHLSPLERAMARAG